MKPLSIAAALAVALTLGTAMAVAQTGPGAHVGDGHNSVTPPNPYGVAGGAARIGDGSDPGFAQTQRELRTEPGYSVGGGSAPKNATEQNGSK
jgi:hypothetical protein